MNKQCYWIDKQVNFELNYWTKTLVQNQPLSNITPQNLSEIDNFSNFQYISYLCVYKKFESIQLETRSKT